MLKYFLWPVPYYYLSCYYLFCGKDVGRLLASKDRPLTGGPLIGLCDKWNSFLSNAELTKRFLFFGDKCDRTVLTAAAAVVG